MAPPGVYFLGDVMNKILVNIVWGSIVGYYLSHAAKYIIVWTN